MSIVSERPKIVLTEKRLTKEGCPLKPTGGKFKLYQYSGGIEGLDTLHDTQEETIQTMKNIAGSDPALVTLIAYRTVEDGDTLVETRLTWVRTAP